MKKIILEKDEGVAEAVDRILNEPDNDVTLVVPNGSALGKTMRNFNILKREVEAAGRDITIESVDENILAFARKSGIAGSHPLWTGSPHGGFSDILSGENNNDDDPPPAHKVNPLSSKSRNDAVLKPEVDRKRTPIKKKIAGETPVTIAVQSEDEEEDENTEEATEDKHGDADKHRSVAEEKKAVIEKKSDEPEKKNFSGGNNFFKETAIPDAHGDESESHRGGAKKVIGYIVLGVMVIAAVFFAVPQFFGSVKVTIDFKKTPWGYSHAFMADKSVATSTVGVADNIIPAQVFIATNSAVQSFHASGIANVSLKATGVITIYNDYSAAPQVLVATTRFVTPDGKIFRLVNRVTVPGAQVADGKIVPSSLNAPIIADQAGAAYNVGPVTKLTVPGFQGTAKYNGFYGSIASLTAGGFVGKKAVPTASDIAAAEANVKNILQSATSSGGALAKIPENFEILDGATGTTITKLTVNTNTDQNGNFNVFGESVFQAIGFDKTKLEAFLLAQAESGRTVSSTFNNSLNIHYSGTQADFTKGIMSFTLDASGTIEPAFSVDNFRSAILGKSVADARSMIASLPELADGTIAAWPSWLANIPSDPGKVRITVN